MLLKNFLGSLGIVLLLVSTAWAAGPITIDKVSESFDAKTNTYTYTVVIKNTGNIAADHFVTAQPYNDKELGADGKPKDSAKRQIQKVTLGGFQKTTVKFTFTGAEGKDWKFKYTDVYNSDPTRGGATMVAGDIGEFALRPVTPGTLLDEAYAFQFPYPYAAILADLGETTFFIDVTEQSLPVGWELALIDPPPGNLFTLSPAQVQLINLELKSNVPVLKDDVGFVLFDFVNPESGMRWNSAIGAEAVPEPATFLLFGVAGLAAFTAKRNRAVREK